LEKAAGFAAMKKPCIQRNLTAAEVARQLPPQYRDRLPRNIARSEKTFALLLFPHDRDDVVISAAVRRALNSWQSTTEDRIIAVAGNFTLEARELLEAARAIVLRMGDYHWTDESYKSIQRTA
jgi:hypothetical protein